MNIIKYMNFYQHSTLKNKNLKINNILIDKYKNMLEKSNFEQNYYSRTAKGISKIGHESFRLMKWLFHYDRSYHENMNYYDLMGSICKHSEEISKRRILCRSKRSSI